MVQTPLLTPTKSIGYVIDTSLPNLPISVGGTLVVRGECHSEYYRLDEIESTSADRIVMGRGIRRLARTALACKFRNSVAGHHGRGSGYRGRLCCCGIAGLCG